MAYPEDMKGWMVEKTDDTPMELEMIIIHDYRKHHYDLEHAITQELSKKSDVTERLFGTFKIYQVFSHVFVTFSHDYIDIGFVRTDKELLW